MFKLIIISLNIYSVYKISKLSSDEESFEHPDLLPDNIDRIKYRENANNNPLIKFFSDRKPTPHHPMQQPTPHHPMQQQPHHHPMQQPPHHHPMQQQPHHHPMQQPPHHHPMQQQPHHPMEPNEDMMQQRPESEFTNSDMIPQNFSHGDFPVGMRPPYSAGVPTGAIRAVSKR